MLKVAPWGLELRALNVVEGRHYGGGGTQWRELHTVSGCCCSIGHREEGKESAKHQVNL